MIKRRSEALASRRTFLQSAFVGAPLAAALSGAAAAAPSQAPLSAPATPDPLAEALLRHGAEFGDLTHIRPGE